MTVIAVADRTYSIMLPHGTRATDRARVSTPPTWRSMASTSSEVPMRAPRCRFFFDDFTVAESSSPGRSRTAVDAVFRFVRRTVLALAEVATSVSEVLSSRAPKRSKA